MIPAVINTATVPMATTSHWYADDLLVRVLNTGCKISDKSCIALRAIQFLVE